MAKRGAPRGNQNARKHGFYSRVLTQAQQVELESASHIEGVDQEIAFLRVKLKELADHHPERLDLQLEAASTIARLIRTHYSITKGQKKTLKESIQKVLTDVALPLGIGISIGSRR